MLKKEQISSIAKILKIEEKDLSAALTDTNEVELKLVEVSTFTTEELKTRDENIKAASYKEGKTAAVDILVKDQKEKLGLDFEGKDPEKLIDAIQKKTLKDAKIEPDKKIEELNGMVKKLQENVQNAEAEKTKLAQEVSSVRLDSKIISMFPSNRVGVLKDEEFLSSLKNEYSFVEEEGKIVAKKGNDIVRDKTTQNPLDVKDVVSGYFTERKWTGEEGSDPNRRGRGAGSEGGNGVYLKLSELTKSFEEQGKSVNGEEFNQAVEAATKANPNFDLNA